MLAIPSLFSINNNAYFSEVFKCMVYFKKTGNKFGIASALDNMASVYREQGITEKVNEYNLRAIQLFEEIDDKPALGRIYNNRGNILAEQKNFDSALIYYKKAINIAESFKRSFGNFMWLLSVKGKK